jgi:phage-related protein
MQHLKQIIWIGSARKDLKKFPSKVRDEIGHSLYLLQQNEEARNCKRLKGFSHGVTEIISDFDKNTFRTVYTAKLGNYLYVLHCFQKKSKSGIKTPLKEIELIKQRLARAISWQNENG